MKNTYLFSLFAAGGMALMLSACGGDSKSNNGPINNYAYQEQQCRQQTNTQQEYNNCMSRYTNNNNSNYSGFIWQEQSLNVTNKSIYRDLLRLQNKCDVSNFINYQLDFNGLTDLDDCHSWDDSIGIQIFTDSLTPSGGQIELFQSPDGYNSSFFQSWNVTVQPLFFIDGRFELVTGESVLTAQNSGVRVDIKSKTLSESGLSVDIYYNGTIFATGTVRYINTQYNQNSYDDYYNPYY